MALEYTPGLDEHRAADLDARLSALGFASTSAFQRAVGLEDDGTDGPYTWAALLSASYPAPDTPQLAVVEDPPSPPAASVDFRAATYNAQLQHFGGGAYSANAQFVDTTLKPSVLAGQEVDEAARTSICQAKGFKVWAYKALGVFWDPNKYEHGDRIEVDLRTNYHGMIGTPLTSVKNGNSFVAASVHIRPRDAFTSDAAAKNGKKADIAKVIAKLAVHPRVVVGGDWSSNARAQMEDAGYQLATPYVDTYDESGTQHLDAVFVRGLVVRGAKDHPTAASDHVGLVASLTLPAPGNPA